MSLSSTSIARDPFAALGPHRLTSGRGVVIRAMHPAAASIDVRLIPGAVRKMSRADVEGLFELHLEARDIPDYRLMLTFADGHQLEIDDPYA
jgi:1,4-alpha-glucan branching enzyme